MRWEDEKGFLLHARPYGETSLIVDLYTKFFGRVQCVAKGYRRPKKRAANRLLIPYVEYAFSWSGRSDLKTLTRAEILGSPEFLRKDSLYFGLYVNELIYRLFLEQDSSESFYEYYKEFVNSLFHRPLCEPLLRKFEIVLLSELGYGLVLDSEAESGNQLEPDGSYLYVPQFGLKKVNKKNTTSYFKGRHVFAIANDDWSNPEVIKAARLILRSAIDFYLDGKPLHSRKLYREFKIARSQ